MCIVRFSPIFVKFPVLRPHLSHFLTNRVNLCKLCEVASMATNSNLKPPPEVSGLTTLDKSLFDKRIQVPCLSINKDVKISSVMPIVRRYLLKLEKFKPVQEVSKQETLIYLNPEMITKWQDFSADAQTQLNVAKLTEENFIWTQGTLKYENFSLETVLRAILPPGVEGMSSFTRVGHIVHVNLRDHLVPFKDIIGQVLYDKVTNCRTVVNKVANIDNTYRNFQMEVLRGDDDMVTTVKENRCNFKFDFSKVYWNSRLCTEHERIVAMIPPSNVIFDVFAGVGPFSIPLAKKKCHVFANDLNPDSYKWLVHNSTTNNVNPDYLKCYNKDGRDFILNDFRELLLQYINISNIYIIMNLPAMAVEFLNAFRGLYSEEELSEIETPPTVIVYCFAKGEHYENIVKNLIIENIGFDIRDKIIDIFRVRTVSSMKEMMRVQFRLDKDILVRSAVKRKLPENTETNVKKCTQVSPPNVVIF